MKGMQYRTQLAQVNQYQRNVSQGFTWLENSESSVNSETDIMGKIRDLMVQAKSDSNGETELKAIGTEIGQLKKQLVSVANTQVNGRYLFNGTNSDVRRSLKMPTAHIRTTMRIIPVLRMLTSTSQTEQC